MPQRPPMWCAFTVCAGVIERDLPHAENVHGLQIEDTQTAEPHRLSSILRLWRLAQRFRIIQLVDARDGSMRGRPVTSLIPRCRLPLPRCFAASWRGQPIGSAIRIHLDRLAWISWIVARLGGWNCYYKPPGPKTMRDGWQRFAAIAEGYHLANPASQKMCESRRLCGQGRGEVLFRPRAGANVPAFHCACSARNRRSSRRTRFQSVVGKSSAGVAERCPASAN